MLNGAIRSVVIKGSVGKEKDFSSQVLRGREHRVANTREIRSLSFRTVSSLAAEAAIWISLHSISSRLRVPIIQQVKYGSSLFVFEV